MANGNKAYQVLTGEKFLRGALVRAFANGFFLLVGWGLVAIFAKKKIAFLNNSNGKRRRRRKRSNFPQHEFSTQMTELSIETNFEKVLSRIS